MDARASYSCYIYIYIGGHDSLFNEVFRLLASYLLIQFKAIFFVKLHTFKLLIIISNEDSSLIFYFSLTSCLYTVIIFTQLHVMVSVCLAKLF